MAGRVTHELGRAPWPKVKEVTLVVVPTHLFGEEADYQGKIRDDELWCPKGGLERARGHHFFAWRYLNDLDPIPGPGADPALVEAWLDRPQQGHLDPLDPATEVLLNSMVMFAAP